MEGFRFITSIRLDSILSFGPSRYWPNVEAFELEPLNVIIGPNASGKSNLIEALSVLHAAPRDLPAPIREGGGVREWIWKGDDIFGRATIEVTLDCFVSPVRYRLTFVDNGGRFDLLNELLEGVSTSDDPDELPLTLYSYHSGGQSMIATVTSREGGWHREQFSLDDVKANQSIFSQRRDPEAYPELTFVGSRFQRMAFYREWSFSRVAPARQAQRVDVEQDRLLEDASNLGLVLNDMMNQPGLKGQIAGYRMRDFYPHNQRHSHQHNWRDGIQIFFHEKGLRTKLFLPTRLSDGSLRVPLFVGGACYILNLRQTSFALRSRSWGLHPDIIPEVAKLLIDASKRSQIFVTTHSDVLVDALV